MNILIIEDEPDTIEHLKKMIKTVAPEKNISGICNSIEQTRQWFNDHEYPDLIIADVQLTDGLSFNAFDQLDQNIPVIYICEFEKYAVNAFKANGIHYLLKPVQQQELKEAIERYNISYKKKKEEKERTDTVVPKPIKKYQERFIIHTGNQIKLVHDYEIAYIYTESKTVFITLFDKQKYIIELSLETFEKSLNPQLFYRINRQIIINIRAISKMVPASKQRIALTLVPGISYETVTSFERTPNFRKWLLGDV